MYNNKFMNGLSLAENLKLTENGGVTRKHTNSKVLDLFALGGSYRKRSDEDCKKLFLDAYNEYPTLALKCLFYLRDILEGQGERRFFRVCYRFLISYDYNTALKNLIYIPKYGRWDDLIAICENTSLEKVTYSMIKMQLSEDICSNTPSLLAKWLPSINTSSEDTKKKALKLIKYLKISPKEYRKMLSTLRKKINVLERLMCGNEWEKIEFDKIPSKAGMIYRKAFERRDIIKEKYQDFATDKNTKVNAKTLYPYDIAHQIFLHYYNWGLQKTLSATEREMIQKYWDNLPDYYRGKKENAIAIVDTSGSMNGTPMEAAVSLGAYIADKSTGPFAKHFITFSNTPHFIKFEGKDIIEKFINCRRADWGQSTNIQAVFDLLLNVAIKVNAKPEDIPERLYIFSDMEFNVCMFNRYISEDKARNILNSDLEKIALQWEKYGYKLPKIIFWNLDARQNTIPALGDRFSYVSGLSPVMVETILSGKDGYDLMVEKLESKRYEPIKAIYTF